MKTILASEMDDFIKNINNFDEKDSNIIFDDVILGLYENIHVGDFGLRVLSKKEFYNNPETCSHYNKIIIDIGLENNKLQIAIDPRLYSENISKIKIYDNKHVFLDLNTSFYNLNYNNINKELFINNLFINNDVLILSNINNTNFFISDIDDILTEFRKKHIRLDCSLKIEYE